MAPALAQRYKDQSAKMSVRYIYEALGHTVKCESDYRASSNQRLLVEFLLVKLAQLQQAQVAAAVAPQTAAPVQQAAPAASSGSPAAAPSMTTAAQVEVGQPEQAAAVEPAAAQQGEAKEAATASNVIAALGSKEPEVPAGEKIVKKPQGGISISSIIKKAQSVPKTQQQEVVAGNESVTMEKLKEAWTKMAQTQSQYPRLATAIKQTEPILKEDGVTVVFKVGNSAQQSWIEKNSLPQLIGFLQKELNNGEVMIKVEVIEAAQQKKVPYTAYEKAEQMRKNYPQVVELTKDLDLDII
jgi:DNA polymerase III gamma/tau subunit